MDVIIDDFQNVKVSALRKVKLISNDIHEVTIGPGLTNREKKHVNSDLKSIPPNKTVPKAITSRLFRDNRVSVGKIMADVEAERRNEVHVIDLCNCNYEFDLRFYFRIPFSPG